ncbi:MAG: 3-oxoacyl-[acyl-carrier-protein] synthase III C-terminal domain-containing protein [Catenulispora sp.]
MTALTAVGTYVPKDRVPIEDLADLFGLTPMQTKVFRRYHKLGTVSRDPGGTLLDLLRGALDDLDALPGNEQRVRYVIHARTFPVVTPYPLNPLRELCRERGLEHAETFAVGHHACASGLLAIDVAGRLLAADRERHPDALALVMTGEKAFTGEARMVPETSFFGEGAAACLVSATGERDRLLSYSVDLRGEFDGDSMEQAMEFQRIYSDALGEAILAAVAGAGLTMADIGLVLPHNVNVVAWQRVCKSIGFPKARVVLDNITPDGHVFCADAFLNYRTASERGLLRPGERYVVAAAGAGRGATFSAMVFEH